ncbi:MAG: hypothetical protein FRX48_05109 [Lasallia pustulata]|uniref:WD40/YVTN repeat-like-containing domain n=1 Tax=Lasallia pustulata TaxID=136370 RepID=A0A5M8PMP8_9LECA|nr:MAG: hypothetical protein FRX48_05109 [Lasallia pustulata]
MAWQEASIGRERLEKYDQHHHKIDWAVYKENYSQEGRDDITSVNLLRTSQRQEDSSEYVVVGRASGGLQCLRLLPEEHESEVVAGYVTDNRPVRGATVSPSMEPLLAACLTDGTVAIYPVTHNKAEIEPLGELEIIPPDKPGRTWSTRFLSKDRLAVGIGPSPTPLHIYQINQAGIHATPLRRFGTSDAGITVYGDTSAPGSTTPSSSIYSLTALPHSSPAGGSPGDLLLSGWYDGCIRQHDTRAPNPTTALYTDSIDGASPIYSLLALGRERFIAGGARHSILKIFDLRMPGGKAYYAADLEACSPPTHSNALCCDYHYQGRYDRRDWNIFLHPPGPGFDKLGRRSAESPVYSLSAPAASAPWFYAGVEGAVVQFEMVGMMDRFPDPVFGFGRAKSGSGGGGLERGVGVEGGERGGGWRAERGGGLEGG